MGTTSPRRKTLLSIGDQAPPFVLLDEQGNSVGLIDYLGENNVILIFYPGDSTPTCTKQLCAARDNRAMLEKHDTRVFGVAIWSGESHRRFASKHDFGFPLLVDADKAVCRAYGCWGLLYVKRTVYGISKAGRITFAERGRPDLSEVVKTFSR